MDATSDAERARKEYAPEPQGTWQPDPTCLAYSGFVILRFQPDVPVKTGTGAEFADNLLDYAEALAVDGYPLDGFSELLLDLDKPRTERVITSRTVAEILEIEAKIVDDEPQPSLAAYWRLDLRDRPPEAANALLDQLHQFPFVDRAYIESTACDPRVVSSSTEQWGAGQDYLRPAPLGINADYAWDHTGGAGVGLADVEQGWVFGHEEFSGFMQHLFPVVGDNRRQAQDGTDGFHGAAVLGLLLAPDNRKGVAGIAPHVARRRTASHYVAASADPGHVANAIQALTPGSSTDDPMKVLSPGDVLLLEVQRGSADFQTNPFFPTEIDAADHRAIQAAVAQGIIVIEAAGNSNCNLDAPGKMPALDSGAILVGAANSGVSQVGNGDPFHLRAEFSNFGQRVHCYGWGDSVVTCGFGTLKPSGSPPVIPDTQTYANDFDGTSAAAALVAGAVVLIQSYYQTKNGRPLTPTEMRGVLTDSQLGTPHCSRTAIAENIGRMPDLKKIFEAIDRGDF